MEDEAESLYHYGVKGMRWGKRKAQDAPKPVSARKERDNAIKTARKDWQSKEDEVTVAFAKYKSLKPGGAAHKRAEEVVMQKQGEYMRNVATASQSTSGEKWVAAIGIALAGVSMASVIGGSR